MSTKKIISRFFNVIYDSLYNFYIRIKLSFVLFANYSKYITGVSCYPDKPSKSAAHIAFQQLGHVWKYGEIDIFYFIYGRDNADCNYADKILNYRTFFKVRNKLNNVGEISYTNIVRDKMLFGIFAKSFGIKTPANIAVTDHDCLYLFDTNRKISPDQFVEMAINLDFGSHFVVKVIDGECGKGVFIVEIIKGQLFIDGGASSTLELKNIITSKVRFLIQEKVIQHAAINVLYSKSVNTLRLCTVCRNGTISVLPSVFRVGTGGAIVDNWSKGGIAIGVDLSQGKLRKDGIYRPEYSKVVTQHPDTKVVFDGFLLPDFAQAVSEAKRFHALIPCIDSIGWDIAFSTDGPCFIEGNDNWEVSLNQASNIGDMGIFKDYFSKL